LKEDSISLKGLNLKSVVHMINAAEPVDQQAIASFYETFRPYGLSSGVVIPTYGLAEHTVFVCSGGSTVLTLRKSSFDNQVIDIISSAVLGESVKSGQGGSGGKRGAEEKGSEAEQIIVGCGFPFRGSGVKVVIVEPDTHRLLKVGKVRLHLNSS
jgi:acyl-CoA synthetase (AMP-forming)/AMP-acid ligase II